MIDKKWPSVVHEQVQSGAEPIFLHNKRFGNGAGGSDLGGNLEDNGGIEPSVVEWENHSAKDGFLLKKIAEMVLQVEVEVRFSMMLSPRFVLYSASSGMRLMNAKHW